MMMMMIPEVNGAVRLRGDSDTEPCDICRLVGEHHDDIASRRLDQVDAVGLGRVTTTRRRGARHQADEILHQVAIVERNRRVLRHLSSTSDNRTRTCSRL